MTGVDIIRTFLTARCGSRSYAVISLIQIETTIQWNTGTLGLFCAIALFVLTAFLCFIPFLFTVQFMSFFKVET